MIQSLSVYFAGRTVGDVSEDDDGRFAFGYAPTWLADGEAFAISRSMPLREEPYRGDEAHAFFANLLPEARIKPLIARRLGLSEDNDFGLLAALGGDCAGALVISEAPPEPGRQDYRPLGDHELEKLVTTGAVFAQLTGHDGIRLSLAGAQDKLPVRVADDDTLLLPLASSPSTHLLKFASRDFAHLPANEAFVGALARALRLPAVDAELRLVGKQDHLLVRRYDSVTLSHRGAHHARNKS